MIFVNPEYVVLLHQVNQKKDELTDKIVEKDRLLAFVCRELKMNYMLKIGSLEYKKMLIENDIKKTERKIEIVKKLKIVTEKTEVRVEEKIRKEFSEETKREQELFADINQAIEYSLKDPITDDKLNDVEASFAVLVRSWNPYINMDLPEQRRIMYGQAEKAYEEGNIDLLERYINLVEEDEIVEQGEIGEMLFKYERYKRLIRDVNNVITEIKSKFPYTEREMLESENLTRRRKNEINQETMLLQEELKEQEKILDDLIAKRRKL
jgi:hypothetical protein